MAVPDFGPLDNDFKTLHIRCGSDIRETLTAAGLNGEFLEFADPYCQGPVPATADFTQFIEQRARFIAQAYGLALKDARKRLEHEYHQLAISHTYERIALWFEHDAYDQLSLVYVLHRFFQANRLSSQTLSLICTDRIDGIDRFVGLGQCSPNQLRQLWSQRQPVTAAQLHLGHETWQALSSPSPMGLFAIAQTQTPALSLLAPALKRHLQELPGATDGLSLTQRLTLKMLTEHGEISAARLFNLLTQKYEPLPFLGDTMYWSILEGMKRCPQPPFQISPDTSDLPWHQRHLGLTLIGKQLLEGDLNWLEINLINRWVGGVHLVAQQPLWCWHPDGPQLLN